MCFKTASEYCVFQYSVKKLIVLLLYYSVRITVCYNTVSESCVEVKYQYLHYYRVSEYRVLKNCIRKLCYNTKVSEYCLIQYIVRILCVAIQCQNRILSVTIHCQNTLCCNTVSEYWVLQYILRIVLLYICSLMSVTIYIVCVTMQFTLIIISLIY